MHNFVAMYFNIYVPISLCYFKTKIGRQNKMEYQVTDLGKSRKENPQKLTQLSSRSHPRHPVGKKDSTKRHHHRHHKRQPGEQQFPKQVVTG